MSLPRTDFDKIGVVPRLQQSGNYAFLRSKVSPVVQSMVQSNVHSPGFMLIHRDSPPEAIVCSGVPVYPFDV